MKLFKDLGLALTQVPFLGTSSNELQGVHNLLQRQVPSLAGEFDFSLVDSNTSHDHYKIHQDCVSLKVHVQGNSKTAILAGVYRVLNEFGHGSISFTHSNLPQIESMPDLCAAQNNDIEGDAVLKERYTFNTCTFGYTMPFFTFEDWEHLLDYLALGPSATMSLAWTGNEQIMIETLKEFGFTNDHLAGFLTSQPYLPWGRFGNIQGNFNSTFDFNVPKQQLKLQKKILKRMNELGIKPILPAFVGFMPREIRQLHPNANVSNATQWNDFPTEFTNTTFLDPLDPLFRKIQSKYLENQAKHFGNVTNLYTLDQFNEVTPGSDDAEYLSNVMSSAVASLKSHNPDAVLVMQGWNFYYDDYWTGKNIKNYLSGAKPGELLILDLFSDHMPLYSKTGGYHGHSFIYNSLHDFGSAMGFEGSVHYLTQNFTQDRQDYNGMVGAGIAPEGLEGNQMMYDVLFAQTWSETALNIPDYVKKFVEARYGPKAVSQELVEVWQDLVKLVYYNDQTTGVYSVPRGILEVRPALSGISDKPGLQPNKLFYDTDVFALIWKRFAGIIVKNPELAQHPHIHNDIVDVTRQYLANEFLDKYESLVSYFNGHPTASGVKQRGEQMLQVLDKLDEVLYTDPEFTLSKWIKAARKMGSNKKAANQLEFQARNLVTGWGPQFQNNDYSARSWAGLVGTYHRPRWEQFIHHLAASDRCKESWLQQFTRRLGGNSNEAVDKSFANKIQQFETDWQWQKWGDNGETWGTKGDIVEIIKQLL